MAVFSYANRLRRRGAGPREERERIGSVSAPTRVEQLTRVARLLNIPRNSSAKVFAAAPDPAPSRAHWPGLKRSISDSAETPSEATASATASEATDTPASEATDTPASDANDKPSGEATDTPSAEATEAGSTPEPKINDPKLAVKPVPGGGSAKVKERSDAHRELLEAERPGNELDLPPNVGELTILDQPRQRGVLDLDVLAIMSEAASRRYDPSQEAIARLLASGGPPPDLMLVNEMPASSASGQVIRQQAPTGQDWQLRGAAVARQAYRPGRQGGPSGSPIMRG